MSAMLQQSTRGGNKDTLWLKLNAKTGVFVQDTTNEAGAKDKLTFTKLADAMVKRVSIFEQPSFEDKNIMEKLVLLALEGPDGSSVVVKMTANQTAMRLIGLVNAADLSKPLTIDVGAFEKGSEGKRRDPTTGEYTVPYERKDDEPWVTAKQDGAKLRADFGGAGVLPPQVEYVEVGKKKIGNPEARNAFMFELAQKLGSKVADAAKGHAPVAPAVQQAAAAPADHDDGVGVADVMGEEAPAAAPSMGAHA